MGIPEKTTILNLFKEKITSNLIQNWSKCFNWVRFCKITEIGEAL